MQCSKLILIWLAAARGLTWGVSHHPRVMLTVTGVSLAKGKQEASQHCKQNCLLAAGEKPLVLRKDSHNSWSRKFPIPGLRNRCPNVEHWKRGMILSNGLAGH